MLDKRNSYLVSKALKTFMLVTVLLILGTMAAAAQEPARAKVIQGFSGGMLLHAGYLFGTDAAAPVMPDGRSLSPQGGVIGIGGCASVHLWKHLRVGCEGFVSTMYQGLMDNSDLLRPGSYIRTGCGGLTADAYWRLPKVWPYAGGAIGGGAMHSLYMLDGDQSNWDKHSDTYVHKQGFFYVTPYVGCNYCMTRKIHLTLRLDWMLAFHDGALSQPTGPRLYLGFIFVH